MRIEITMGEIKSIIYNTLNEIKTYPNTDSLYNDLYNVENQSCPNIIKELENENPFLFP